MVNTVSAPYSAMTIANYIIYYAKKNNLEMNNLKLQKILLNNVININNN